MAMDLPRAADPDDALAQTTRARLFALLGELRRPVGTAELAERLELHPNGVRLHLERLEAANLVERTRERGHRGRPPDFWTIAPGALPGGQPPRAYHDLGRWLARALHRRGGLRGIESTGREIGHELAPKQPSAGCAGLRSALSALGFQPVVEQRGGDRVTVHLGNCPYRDAVRENQPAVCALHKGITQGLLDELAPGAMLAAWHARDPEQAGCEIEIEGLATE